MSVDPATLTPENDLYAAGLTSHASVSLMLALEDAFDIEFPEQLLKRSTFGSIAAIEEAITDFRRGPSPSPEPTENTRSIHVRHRHPSGVRLHAATRAGRRRHRQAGRSGLCRAGGRGRRPQGALPFETFEALRRERMLSLLVPEAFGGSEIPMTKVALAVQALGRHCGSSALIYAMHHIQVAVLARHGQTEWAQDYLRTVATDELLLASATSEIGTGGDVRSSLCAIEPAEDRFTLRKQTPVISYGRKADCVLATRAAPAGQSRPATRCSSCSRHRPSSSSRRPNGTRSASEAPAATDSC